jgi:hypothetical protein
MYDHCVKVFEAMFRQAKPELLEGSDEPMMVYNGHLTKLVCDDLRLPVPYYTATKNELIRMNCIRQLRRGGGNGTSQWLLLATPTEELWRANTPPRTRPTARMDYLEQQNRDLANRLATVESLVNQILGGSQ